MGVINMLEAVRIIKSDTRFYPASSSETFGKVIKTLQKGTTPLAHMV